jgi:recombination protein RecA
MATRQTKKKTTTKKKRPAKKKTTTEKKAEKKVKEAKDIASMGVVEAIQKRFGAGAAMYLGRGRPIADVKTISTGSIGLDTALGVGGVPRGRITEVYGPEAGGKTTLTLHVVAEAQKAKGRAAFVDAEHALDLNYAKALGVDVANLMFSQPDHGEQALEIVDMYVRSGEVDVVVIDSVAALVPKAELEGEMGDSHMGLQARLMSQALRKLTGAVARSNVAVVFINQTRHKIGVMFGSPETTTGGNALKFYASLRLDVRRIASLKKGEEIVGIQTRVRVIKNKLAPPFKEALFDIVYGTGISKEGELVNMGVDMGFVDKSGAWFSYDGTRIGQGRPNAVAFLREHTEYAAQIEKDIRSFYAAERAKA